MAIGNIAEHCQRKHAKPISDLSYVQQLTKIQVIYLYFNGLPE